MKLTLNEFFGKNKCERMLSIGDVIQVTKSGYEFTIVKIGTNLALVDMSDCIGHCNGFMDCCSDSASVADFMDFYDSHYLRVVKSGEVYTKEERKLKMGTRVHKGCEEYIIGRISSSEVELISLDDGNRYSTGTKVKDLMDISRTEAEHLLNAARGEFLIEVKE